MKELAEQTYAAVTNLPITPNTEQLLAQATVRAAYELKDRKLRHEVARKATPWSPAVLTEIEEVVGASESLQGAVGLRTLEIATRLAGKQSLDERLLVRSVSVIDAVTSLTSRLAVAPDSYGEPMRPCTSELSSQKQREFDSIFSSLGQERTSVGRPLLRALRAEESTRQQAAWIAPVLEPFGGIQQDDPQYHFAQELGALRGRVAGPLREAYRRLGQACVASLTPYVRAGKLELKNEAARIITQLGWSTARAQDSYDKLIDKTVYEDWQRFKLSSSETRVHITSIDWRKYVGHVLLPKAHSVENL